MVACAAAHVKCQFIHVVCKSPCICVEIRNVAKLPLVMPSVFCVISHGFCVNPDDVCVEEEEKKMIGTVLYLSRCPDSTICLER
jgi:hypothetical protein